MTRKYVKQSLCPPTPLGLEKRDNICCAAICIGLISTPILLLWRAPASPFFLSLPPSVHIHPNDYLNGCQKNTVTRLIWAVWESREEEWGPAIFHTPFYRAGTWREGEREAVAMATCWQLLSLCLESAGCSHSTQCLGGSRGRKEVMGRKSGCEGVGRRRGERRDDEMGSKGGVALPKGTIARSHHHRGNGLLPGKRATKAQHWGPRSIPALRTYTHVYTHQCWWQAWQRGGVEDWQWVIASLPSHNLGVSFSMKGCWSVSWMSVLSMQCSQEAATVITPVDKDRFSCKCKGVAFLLRANMCTYKLDSASTSQCST